MDPAEVSEGGVKVNKTQLKKAITALQGHVQKKNEESNLLFNKNAETMTLLFSLAKIPEKGRLKPTLIPLPHPLYGEMSEICIFTKDPQKKYKELFAAHPVPGLKKVISIEKLKKNYKSYDLKRQLCDNYDLFLCDKRVVEMMPQLLGKYFYQTKKRPPVPVVMQEKDPTQKVQEAINSTTLRIPEGPSCGVKIGRCEMEVEDLVRNAARVMSRTSAHFHNMGNSITSISLQATNAPALPIWHGAAPAKVLERTPGGGGAAAASSSGKKTSGAEAADEEDDEDEESEEDLDPSKPSKPVRKADMPLMQSGKRKRLSEPDGPVKKKKVSEDAAPTAPKKKGMKKGKA